MPCTPNLEVLRKYLTTNDIARLLSKHPSAVVRWILRGTLLSNGERRRLQALRSPGGWLIAEEWLDNFLDAITADRLQPEETAASKPVPQTLRIATMRDGLAEAGFLR